MNSTESSQDIDENDPTLQLAKLMISRSRYHGKEIWEPGEMAHTYRMYTPDLVREVVALLEAGADKDLVVCAFLINGQLYHSILETKIIGVAKFSGSTYGITFPYGMMQESYLRSKITHIVTPLTDAAEQKDTEALSMYSSMGLKLDGIIAKLTSHDFTPYHLRNPFLPTLVHRRVDVVRQLLYLTAPAEWLFKQWLNDALLAVLWPSPGHSPDLEMVKLLQERGADLSSHQIPRLGRLYERVVSCTQSSFNKACQTERTITVPWLDEVNLFNFAVATRSSGWARGPRSKTALMIATGCATTAMCRLLLHCGAEPDETDDFNMTALADAIHWGHLEAIDLLLEHGANPNHVIDDRRAPMSLPCEEKHEITGSWPHLRDTAAVKYQNGNFSLSHIAACLGRTRVLEVLCAHGADMTVIDLYRRTPLEVAVQSKQDLSASFLRTNLSSKLLGGRPSSLKTHDKSPQSTAQLCVACTLAFETGVFGAVPDANESNHGCRFCQLLLDCGYTGANGLMALTYGSSGGSTDQAVEMRSARGLLYRHPVLKVSDDVHAVLQRLNYAEAQDEDTSSQIATSQIAHWLGKCVEDHLHCRRDHASWYFPTRVLDIGELYDNQYPKLREHASLRQPYVALSHRWGLQGLPVTTLENIADRCKMVDPDQLSETMRNAIAIVRSLGYRYIWIDALCIIQDSTEDWLTEASKMSSVFSGAVLTIAVADAEDHTQGIFRKRLARCTRPFPVPYMRGIPHRDRFNVDSEANYYIFPRSDLVGAGARPKGTLDTRGWILQEQLLSTRILYYDRGQVYWDCVTLSASESSPITASLLQETDPDESWALKLVRRTLAGALTGETLRDRISDAWLGIMKNYSARELTKVEDRLIALEGIIKPLKGIIGEEPIAGMWRRHFWRQLTWWTHNSAESQLHNRPVPAPSWSWLAVPKRVYYHNSLLGERPAECAAEHKFTELRPYSFMIDDVQSKHLPGISGVTGTLTVTGKSFAYHLSAMDLKKPVYKRWNSARLKLNTERWMLDHPIQLPVELQCLIVAEDAVAKMIVCLCLVPDNDRQGKWKRVGLCHWDGLAWQIPSFTGKAPETRSFTIV